MTLTAVKSSHVAAVGLVEPDGVLLVRYRDGSLHARPGWTAGSLAALLAAPSVGKFLAATSGGSIRISGKEGTVSSIAGADLEVQRGGRTAPLVMIDEDADKCCRAGLAPFLSQNSPITSWECGTCGTGFVREVFPDLTRYWRIHPSVEVARVAQGARIERRN